MIFSATYKKFTTTLRYTPVLFISVWIILFAVLSLWLISRGIAPAMVLGETDEEVVTTAEPTIIDRAHADEAVIDADVSSEPVRIVIDTIGIDTPIENPEATDITTLDTALTRGAVHYPGSGNLEDTSNMFLFGHSSQLPVVHNQAYRAFNDLGKLVEGDLIRVQSETREYHYRVESVEQVRADEAWVEFDSDEKKLTLSTCNNFGSKQDRFVVEASFIGSFPLST